MLMLDIHLIVQIETKLGMGSNQQLPSCSKAFAGGQNV